MKDMSSLSVVAIVAFVVAAIFFVLMVVVFFSNEITDAIRILRNGNPQKRENTQSPMSKTAPISVNSTQDRIATTIPHTPVVSTIDDVQQTVDDYNSTLENSNLFPTVDWNLPDGISFILTKNIIVFHSDKEYIVRENI